MRPPHQPQEARAVAVFIGRHRELAELRAGLGDAVSGRGRFFLVVGEAGIGKTRLVEELAREAAEQGGLAFWGRCWEGAGAPPYWPWVQVIRAYLRTVRLQGVAVGAGAPYLAQLVPELGEQLRDLSAPSISLQSEHARFYLFDAVATFLKSAAERMPLVLVFDDLQWADVPSLLLLQFLAHELRDARMLLLGTYREVEVRQAPMVGPNHFPVGATTTRSFSFTAEEWARYTVTSLAFGALAVETLEPTL